MLGFGIVIQMQIEATLIMDAGDELISPCRCKGTQQFVHRSCLDHWRSVKVVVTLLYI